MKLSILYIPFILFQFGCSSLKTQQPIKEMGLTQNRLRINYIPDIGEISVVRENNSRILLTQITQQNIRPYIHPITAPDGKGVLTQFSPEHHKHQTGLYWGLKQVNGRDYFMNWKEDYWQKVSATVVQEKGTQVKWQTVYQLLDENKQPILTETQAWAMQEQNGQYLLDLEWKGEAKQEITIGKFYVGGLFLRMPWHEGINGEVITSAAQRNQQAEGQRAIWADIGIQVDGRSDLAHIAIFDHPDNAAFPTPWRVDNELGMGPSRQILGDWKIGKDQTATFRYRLIVYTGVLNQEALTRQWKAYICDGG
jgi:hypothetical protein